MPKFPGEWFARMFRVVLSLSMAGLLGCSDSVAPPYLGTQGHGADGRVEKDESSASLTRPTATEHAGPLLVVFTYGNWCSADGWGYGLRDVSDAIREQFPKQRVITRVWDDADHIDQTIEQHHGPVAMIGHSFGGSRSIEIAAKLHRQVDWLILLDPVPADDWAIRRAGQYFNVPATVHGAICYYRAPGLWPLSYSILNPAISTDNRLRDWGHFAFCDADEVRRCILEVCAREDARR
jgi:pimeloyl-ACP methyl ester carboxylesterase